MRQRREICGMPQKKLARQLGISFQQVQKYESGANRISASKLWQLCGVLDVTPGFFFEASIQKEIAPDPPIRPSRPKQIHGPHARCSTSIRHFRKSQTPVSAVRWSNW